MTEYNGKHNFPQCTGLPLPVISFSINGIAVRSDATHRILVRENNVHSLLFEQVSLMEQGLYEITAKNRAGTNVARVNLKVKGESACLLPCSLAFGPLTYTNLHVHQHRQAFRTPLKFPRVAVIESYF